MNYRIFLCIFLCSILSSCNPDKHYENYPVHGNTPPELDSIGYEFGRMMHNGDHDSVIAICRPKLDQAQLNQDTTSVIFFGLNLSQAYLIEDYPDSVQYCFDILKDYNIDMKEGHSAVFANHLHGIYTLRYELDYKLALDYFIKAYECAEEVKDWNNAISELANIVNIFYAQHDGSGLEYAQKALEISKQHAYISEYNRLMLDISLASMQILNDQPEEALKKINELERRSDSYNIDFIIKMLKGDIYYYLHDDENAEYCFKEALEYIDRDAPEAKSLIFLKYGDLLKSQKKYRQALNMYQEGLESCSTSGDVIYLKDLLSQLSDTYNLMGSRDSSLIYQSMYHKCIDSLKISASERGFYQRLRTFQKLQHELDMMAYEKRLVTAISIAIITILIIVFLTILFIRQRHMYRALVIQHQRYAQQLKSSREAAMMDHSKETKRTTGSPENSDAVLFQKIESLMKENKLYRTKNLTLDKIAEEAGTNRSYVSRAINSCANMTFCNYLDNYRITEATALISEKGNDIPFKQMAEDLGYNSVSVFYRSFQREIGCPPGRYREEISKINKEEQNS